MTNLQERIDNLLKELKYNSTFNPFHPNFNIQNVMNAIKDIEIENLNSSNKNLHIFSLIKILPNIHRFNKGITEQINRCIKETNMDLDELQELLVRLANHYFLFAQSEANKKYKETEARNYEDALSIPSQIVAKAETIIDTNNILYNYFKNYYKTVYKVDENKPKNKDLTVLNKISGYTQIFSIYKSFYEKCLYENFYVEEKSIEENLIYYSYMVDKKYHMARKISDIRYSKYTFGYLIHLDQFQSRKKLLYKTFSPKVKNKKIEKIIFENTELKYVLTTANEDNLDEFSHLLCFLMPFYSFLISDKENADLINDCLILYAKFQEFFKKVVENTNFKFIETPKDIDNIPFKIKKNILKTYFMETTNIKETTISKFLKTLSNGKFINFFKKPLLSKDNDYLFHFLNSTANIAVNIIDDWLEENNFKIEERGIIFEQFIKNELTMIFQEKKYNYYIFNKSKFKSTNIEEEIDLIIVLDNIILLGEAKCIKYPIEIRDIDNACGRVLEGVEQVKRKMEFIKNNEDLFNIDGITIKGKTIIPFVITNYPCFSSWCPDGIPVVDYELIRNYIETGALLYGKIEFKTLMEQGGKEYYSNQKEFEERFSEFLNNPVPILDINEKLELTYEMPIMETSIFMAVEPKLVAQIYKFKNIVEQE